MQLHTMTCICLSGDEVYRWRSIACVSVVVYALCTPLALSAPQHMRVVYWLCILFVLSLVVYPLCLEPLFVLSPSLS